MAASVWCAHGCGPELNPTPDVRSGYYRAESIETDDACGMGAVWSSNMVAAYSSEAYQRVHAQSVPIRAHGLSIEVPEPSIEVPEREADGAAPHAPLPSSSPGTLQPLAMPWRMRPLAREAASYELEVFFDITFCESYRHAWTAVVLDEETIHVTREGSGCGAGDGYSQICDNHVAIEYVLEQTCEPPCEFVDDRDTRFPGAQLGDDLILRDSRCSC
jgi:hypothetical protein